MNQNYWSRKKVLVTGADGFIGSHLTEKLLALGARVSVLVRGTSINGTNQFHLRNTNHLKKKLDHIIAVNIGSTDCIPLVTRVKPQVIFHLAADAYVPYSFDRPLEVMTTNLHGTLNMLAAALRLKRLERIVCTSSSEVYGSALKSSIDENHPLNPTSPYAASKVSADRFAYSYYQTYGLPLAIIRPFNTYGPRHTYDVIPKFIRMALGNEPITIHGTGEQSRDFTYVDDMVRAFLLMGQSPKAVGEVVNFGTHKDISINRTARLIVELSQSKSKIIHIPKRIAEVQKLRCDASKAYRLFGWRPKISIEEGLRRNIEWAREHQNQN